jgi:uncharacterized secreted protein with C-terminal beta-propeller domain
MMTDMWWGGQGYTKIRVYNITNKEKVGLEKEFSFDGSYNTSRKVGNQVYIVGNKYSYYNPNIYDDKGKVIGERSVEEVIPSYKDSAKDDKWTRVSLNDIRYFSEEQSSNFLCLASIDISDSDKPALFKTYLGDGYQVYASTENLYVVGTIYNTNNNNGNTSSGGIAETKPVPKSVSPDTAVSSSGASDAGGTVDPVDPSNVVDPVPPVDPVKGPTQAGGAEPAIKPSSTPKEPSKDDASDAIAVPPEESVVSPVYYGPDTVIYKFVMNNGDIKSVAEGKVPGSIINQFSMDESNGYFRIATTTYIYNSTKGNQNSNNVYVLDSKLKLAGRLENLAIGENIYSVRFMGEKAYIVTFKTVDPLFVIDMSNPVAPKVLGELKISGFSNYLHPYDENHIIGFGMDTKEVDENRAITNGMKVAMFDVTDVNNPKEMFKIEIGDRGTYSSLLNNHKALLFSKEKNIMAFPVNLHEIKSGNKGDTTFEYGQLVYQGFYVYGMDMDKGFTLKGRVTHMKEGDIKADSYNYYSSYDYMKEIQRGIYIENTLITVSGSKLVTTDLNGMKELDELVLK